MTERGKIIAVLGPNNIGKSTQVGELSQRLKDDGFMVRTQKYPVYDLEPTGPKINAVLREGVQMPEEDLQVLFAQNRRDYEPNLKNWGDRGGVWILEDYKGTGRVWGEVHGISRERMREINEGLIEADINILLDGQRFVRGIEEGHKNENDEEKWKKARRIHRELAEEEGWAIVDANGTVEEVAERIYPIARRVLE